MDLAVSFYSAATQLAQLASGPQLPLPPSPAAFEAYGFAGVIFASFFFLTVTVIVLGWRYFTNRDATWFAQQEKRDAQLEKALTSLSLTHEKAVERVVQSNERTADASVSQVRELAGSVRELAKEVQSSHRAFGEEALATILRRVMREVRAEGGHG